MGASSPYLDGFLAAARPADRAAGNLPVAQSPLSEEVSAGLSPSPDGRSFEEKVKRRLHPLDSFARLLDCAATNRPPDEEDRFRFEWFGLFYQAPAQDAFLLRLRLPGGRLRPFQFAGLAEITQGFAGGQVALNAAGGLDVPGVPITSADRILSEVESIGLSAQRTGGDCVQAIRGGEYDGADPGGSAVPTYPRVRALEQALTHGWVFADLPRPCEIVFQNASETDAVRPSAMDTLIMRAELEPVGSSGVLLHLPGQAEEGFRLASDSVVPCCLSLLQAWAKGADRSSRESAGLAKFLSSLDPEALNVLLRGAKRVPLPLGQGRSTRPPPPGFVIPGGRLLSGQLAALEQCCLERDWREVRLANGRLHPVGAGGEWVEDTALLTRALSI